MNDLRQPSRDVARAGSVTALAVSSLVLAVGMLVGMAVHAERAEAICIIPWCTYYNATPPVANQWQCGNKCARDTKTHHRMSTASSPAHRIEIFEANSSGTIPGTQVSGTGTNIGVTHASMLTNQYCRNSVRMNIKCDWY